MWNSLLCNFLQSFVTSSSVLDPDILLIEICSQHLNILSLRVRDILICMFLDRTQEDNRF